MFGYYNVCDQGYLSDKVFEGACGVMQPFDQQSKELFDDQTEASDLIGSSSCYAFWHITWIVAIGVWNKSSSQVGLALHARASQLPKHVFSLQQEHLHWPEALQLQCS